MRRLSSISHLRRSDKWRESNLEDFQFSFFSPEECFSSFSQANLKPIILSLKSFMVYHSHWPIPTTLGKRQIDHETALSVWQLCLENQAIHTKTPLVINVAGTNGKGSATSLIGEIFAKPDTKLASTPRIICTTAMNELFHLARKYLMNFFLK